jgi:hypothetical protein
VVEAGGESMRHTDVLNLHRCVFLNGAAVSELALIVHTPCIGKPVRSLLEQTSEAGQLQPSNIRLSTSAFGLISRRV